MKDIRSALIKRSRPVRAVQFGTGVFLRGFADWMLDRVNEQTGWNGSVVLVKSTSCGNLETLRGQDGLYTVVLRGLAGGRPAEEFRGITAVDSVVDCNAEYARYAALACADSLRFVLSNTTEAGIVLDEGDRCEFCPPHSFPGKLAKFLYERARHFDYAPDKGLIVLPMELVDRNGGRLCEIVHALARKWGLEERFLVWLDESCVFADTLVDRIVAGYPADAERLWEKMGYRDGGLVAAEPYGLWVIRCSCDLESELPLQRAGLPVVYAGDLAPYRTRKVRILNGAHTAFAPAAFLAGLDIVRDAVLDIDFSAFIRKTLAQEVLPTIDLPRAELENFAGSVLERFANPYIDHRLRAICLNSVSKWRERILPTALDCAGKGIFPDRLVFSLAALLALYETRPDAVSDEEPAMRLLAAHRGNVAAILAQEALWGMDLNRIPGFSGAAVRWRAAIDARGVRACIKELNKR